MKADPPLIPTVQTISLCDKNWQITNQEQTSHFKSQCLIQSIAKRKKD